MFVEMIAQKIIIKIMKKKGERRENLKYFSFVEYRKSYQQIYIWTNT